MVGVSDITFTSLLYRLLPQAKPHARSPPSTLPRQIGFLVMRREPLTVAPDPRRRRQRDRDQRLILKCPGGRPCIDPDRGVVVEPQHARIDHLPFGDTAEA